METCIFGPVPSRRLGRSLGVVYAGLFAVWVYLIRRQVRAGPPESVPPSA